MSWSCYVMGKPAAEAKAEVEANYGTPDSIKSYLQAGIDHLVSKHGEDVSIRISSYGHLGSEGSVEETTATIQVEKTSPAG